MLPIECISNMGVHIKSIHILVLEVFYSGYGLETMQDPHWQQLVIVMLLKSCYKGDCLLLTNIPSFLVCEQ